MAVTAAVKPRCAWAPATDALYLDYHDREWGVPLHDEHRLFEFLILEGAQAGLSWATILRKRDAYRQAFDGFDPHKVARFDRRRVEKLLTNPGIVRNRLKIAAAVTNAQAFLAVQDEHGSFDAFLWRYVDGEQIRNHWRTHQNVPSSTPLSDALSTDLKKRGFKFAGSTICYAYMQAVGLVNDHITGCFRYRELER